MLYKSKLWNWLFPSNSNSLLRYGLLFLIGIDVAFILLHLSVELTTSSVPTSISITKDGSFPEIFQYIKYGITGIILGRFALKFHSVLYGAWAILFTYILFDDWLALHEQGGLFLAHSLNIADTSFLRGQDFGEIAITGIASLLIIVVILISHFRCKQHQDRKISRSLALLLGLLAVCGVGFDMLQIAVSTLFSDAPVLSNIFALLEDGGEMFVASLIAWFAIQILINRSQASRSRRKSEWNLRHIEVDKQA